MSTRVSTHGDHEGEVKRSARMARAWRLSTRSRVLADHNIYSRQIADSRAAVELAPEELGAVAPDPLAQSDMTALLHNLIGRLLQHQDCNEEYIAEAVDRADELVDRQARELVTALESDLDPRSVSDQRWVLEDAVELRADARRVAGLGDR